MKSQINIFFEFIFRCNVYLPVVLDFEIWKASNMLFQNIPYEGDKEERDNLDTLWDDSWHKNFKTEPPSEVNTRQQNHDNNCSIRSRNIQSKEDQTTNIDNSTNESDLLNKHKSRDIQVDANFNETEKITNGVSLVSNRENTVCKVDMFTASKEKNALNSFKSSDTIYSKTERTFKSEPANQNYPTLDANKNVGLVKKNTREVPNNPGEPTLKKYKLFQIDTNRKLETPKDLQINSNTIYKNQENLPLIKVDKSPTELAKLNRLSRQNVV